MTEEDISIGNGVSVNFHDGKVILYDNGNGAIMVMDELMFCRLEAFVDKHWNDSDDG